MESDSEPALGPTLSELGEFAIIGNAIADRIAGPGTVLGPGDDGAVLLAPDGRVVITTDMLVEGRHFRLDWSAPHDVGRKAIAQNAADIAAMGAATTGFVVAVGAPGDTRADRLQALSDGMWAEAARVGAGIVGGDLVAAAQWVVSVAALGDLGGRRPVTRSGATVGATVAVCGELGRSAAGYALLDKGLGEGAGAMDELRRRHRVPQPPYKQGVVAAEYGAGAMIDISDGLIADLRHVAEASSVGLELSTSALADDWQALIDAAAIVDVDAWSWVFAGGEDHALAATFAGGVPPGWRVIGTVVDGPARVLVDGRDWTRYAGWRSFG